MSQRKDTGLNTNPWPKLVDHYIAHALINTTNSGLSKRNKINDPGVNLQKAN